MESTQSSQDDADTKIILMIDVKICDFFQKTTQIIRSICTTCKIEEKNGFPTEHMSLYLFIS